MAFDSAKGKEELKRLLGADIAAFPDAFEVELDEPSRIIEDQKKMSELLDQMPGGLGLFELTEKGVYTYYMNNGLDVKASLDAGMNAHLGKPIVPKDLYETLVANLQ